jgi:hypothetical protein
MMPVQPRARAAETEKGPCYATCRRHAICYLARADVPRIERLAVRVRLQLQESPERVSQAAVLRALLLKGLDLAEAAGLALAAIEGDASRLEYLVRPIEFDRLELFRQAHWLPSKQPSLERLQGAFIRLALPLAETSQSFARGIVVARRSQRKANHGR